MKFIHCSDIHLDSAMDTRFTARQAKDRNAELCRSFARMARYAAQEGVTAVLICGDLFDTHRVTGQTLRFILDCISAASAVDFLYLKGNHDEAEHLFRGQSLPENLKLFGRDWTYYTYDNVTIAGAEQPDDSALSLQSDNLNIVMLHGQISNRTGEDLVCLPALRGKHIDYLALGHLHSHQTGRLDDRGTYAYSGCPEGRGFDECGTKGFVELEADASSLSHRFVPFAQRCLHDIPVDITGCTTAAALLDAVTAATEGIPQQDLVNITLTGTYTPDTQKDTAFLHTMLTDRFYYLKFKDQSRLYIDPVGYAKDVSLKGEFVRTVLASDLPQEEQDRIICLGLAALQGDTL